MPMHSVYGDALDLTGVVSVRTLITSPHSAGKMMEVVILNDEGRHGAQWILKRLTHINKLIWVNNSSKQLHQSSYNEKQKKLKYLYHTLLHSFAC